MSSSASVGEVVSPPGEDELEVSLFGPGVGESVVVHMGGGRWLVVDSCIDRASGRPVAMDYLEGLGVDLNEQVDLVVVTHWHDDHCKGVAELMRTATNAELVLSSAMRSRELSQLLAASSDPLVGSSGALELRSAVLTVGTRPKRDRAWFRWAHAGTQLIRSETTELYVLSPSDEAFMRAQREIGALIPKPDAAKRRIPKQGPNDLCVALWLRVRDTAVLLGADLERGGAAGGWKAVLAHPARPTTPARIFKVPHHGSPGADEPDVWRTMLAERPWALMTAYATGRRPLPDEEDLLRLRQRTDRLFLTSPARGKKPRKRPPPVERTIRATAPDMREVTGPMGHVRLRVGPNPADVSVRLFGRARHVAA